MTRFIIGVVVGALFLGAPVSAYGAVATVASGWTVVEDGEVVCCGDGCYQSN